MKLTLLDIVQRILMAMDSDEVNSITDTVESQQVAYIVRESYEEIVASLNLPEHYKLFELEPSNDPDKPTLMYLPDDVHTLLWVKYDKSELDDDAPRYEYVHPLPLEEFVDLMHNIDSGDTNYERYTHSIGSDSIDIMCYNNIHPRYFTQYDDHTLIFDSYNNTVDTTLQKNKTSCYGLTIPSFTMSDSFVPDLDAKQFPYLLAEAKRQAFTDLKQQQNPIAEQRAKRGRIRAQKDKEAIRLEAAHRKLPNYGRR